MVGFGRVASSALVGWKLRIADTAVLRDLRLSLDPACREYALGVAVGLLTTFENQIARRLECDIAIGIIPETLVAGVARVLLIDDASHIF